MVAFHRGGIAADGFIAVLLNAEGLIPLHAFGTVLPTVVVSYH